MHQKLSVWSKYAPQSMATPDDTRVNFGYQYTHIAVRGAMGKGGNFSQISFPAGYATALYNVIDCNCI